MLYRKLGMTGREVSENGLGYEHLDNKPYGQVKETIDAALEQGVNFLDVFMPEKEIRENIAKALGDRRNKVMLLGQTASGSMVYKSTLKRKCPAG